MIAKIEEFARQFRAEAGQQAERVIASLRKATVNTADFIAAGKSPVRKIADTGVKLNRISHKGVEKLVKNQATFIETSLDDGAARLKLAARADNFRSLVGDQMASLDSTRQRAVGQARKNLDIVVDTGTEIRGVVQGAIADLRPAKPARTVKRTSKKVAKKATATRKKVAKKTRATTKSATAKAKSAGKTAAKKVEAAKPKLQAVAKDKAA